MSAVLAPWFSKTVDPVAMVADSTRWHCFVGPGACAVLGESRHRFASQR
jgi:hypothetical protein